MFLDERNKELLFDDLDLPDDKNDIYSPEKTSYIPRSPYTPQASPILPEDDPVTEPPVVHKKASHSIHVLLGTLWEYLLLVAIAVVLALFINHFVILNANVPTGSMNNTIMEDDRLIGLRLSYYFSDPKRGEIVIFRYPDDPEQLFIKRVIGTPGDVVEIKTTYNIQGLKETNVYVNGEKLYEPYIKEPMDATADLQYLVPADCYFVMGDNRNNSLDSRYWQNTFVERKDVLAKAIFKYYPKMKFINTKYE